MITIFRPYLIDFSQFCWVCSTFQTGAVEIC